MLPATVGMGESTRGLSAGNVVHSLVIVCTLRYCALQFLCTPLTADEMTINKQTRLLLDPTQLPTFTLEFPPAELGTLVLVSPPPPTPSPIAHALPSQLFAHSHLFLPESW